MNIWWHLKITNLPVDEVIKVDIEDYDLIANSSVPLYSYNKTTGTGFAYTNIFKSKKYYICTTPEIAHWFDDNDKYITREGLMGFAKGLNLAMLNFIKKYHLIIK